MVKIVVTQDLNINLEEKERLSKLGEVKYYDNLSKTPEEWLERCKDADIIYTGKFGLIQKVYDLKNTFICLPFVGTGFLDIEKLKARNIQVARSPGCNKEAVSEWIIAMILNLLREFPSWINKIKFETDRPNPTLSLAGKNITILGKGNVGERVGRICESLDMNVNYLTRGGDLISSIKNADIVVDTLSLNESTIGLLNKNFFNSFKKSSYFVTVTSSKIYDADALFEVLDKGILVGVANDCGSIFFGDTTDPFYIKFTKHPKVLATPHIAHNTDVTDEKANKMSIDNMEAYLKGKPINLIY
jgi:phosphoglycerate dehydrogenase-like enzyme